MTSDAIIPGTVRQRANTLSQLGFGIGAITREIGEDEVAK